MLLFDIDIFNPLGDLNVSQSVERLHIYHRRGAIYASMCLYVYMHPFFIYKPILSFMFCAARSLCSNSLSVIRCVSHGCSECPPHCNIRTFRWPSTCLATRLLDSDQLRKYTYRNSSPKNENSLCTLLMESQAKFSGKTQFSQ